MKTTLSWPRVIGVLLALFVVGKVDCPVSTAAPTQSSIPYVATRHDTVRDMMWLADVGTNDVVYDLGSGDGRVVIAAVRDFHARKAVGIEVKPELIRESQENALKAGVANRVEFRQGDLFTNDISEASVVVLYLGQKPNIDLRAKLLHKLKPGARIVSHQFGMGEWAADKLLDVRKTVLGMYGEWANPFRNNPEVPDYDNVGTRATHDPLWVWTVPARVAGVWQGRVKLGAEEAELTVRFHQRLGLWEAWGNYEWRGKTNFDGVVQSDLWGPRMRFHSMPGNKPYAGFDMWFDGQVKGEAMKGDVWVTQGKVTQQGEWEGRREQVNLGGTWSWPQGSNGVAQLSVTRGTGGWEVSYVNTNRSLPMYVDGKKPIPVTDFYDFGGGFYFTLLLGQEGGSRRIGPDEGWLIGEGVVANNTLTGSLNFFGYPESHFAPSNKGSSSAKEERRRWEAKRAAP